MACKQHSAPPPFHLPSIYANTVAKTAHSDGHTVTTQTALWSVPAYILPRTPNALLPKSAPKGRSARALFGKRDDLCNPKSGCDEAEDCWAQNCANCREATHECVGGPTGCLTTPSQCWGEL
jgi:hypothetical protein